MLYETSLTHTQASDLVVVLPHRRRGRHPHQHHHRPRATTPFILGSTNPDLQPLHDLMVRPPSATAKPGPELQRIEDEWLAAAPPPALRRRRRPPPSTPAPHADKPRPQGPSTSPQAKGKSKRRGARRREGSLLGKRTSFFDWGRAPDEGGLTTASRAAAICAVNRAHCLRALTAMLSGWRASCPTLLRPRSFADGVHAVWAGEKSTTLQPLPLFPSPFPHLTPITLHTLQKLTSPGSHTNLSPSFNWKTAMPRDEQERRTSGGWRPWAYCWQFHHAGGPCTRRPLISGPASPAPYSEAGNARPTASSSRSPEIELGVDVVKHQKWSGRHLRRMSLQKMVTGGISSTAAMGKGVTEDQFPLGERAACVKERWGSERDSLGQRQS